MRIEPRKKSDRGGYLCMPLMANVPHPRDKTWTPARCPECGRGCWDRPLPDGFMEYMFDGKLCTECALRKNAYPGR